MQNDKIIDQLNSFLRGEISAVETYKIGRDKVSALGPQGEIDLCLRSHEEHVQSLTARISSLGGEPAQSSGLWGVFAKAVEGSAAVLGEAAAIAALEEGEDHGLRDYRSFFNSKDANDIDDDTRAYLVGLLNRQLKTHAIMSNLKQMMKGQPSQPTG